MFLEDILKRYVRLSPQKKAVVWKDQSLSYEAWFRRILSVASGLQELGVKKGDRVGIFSKNCLESMDLCLATSLIGAIYVPINFRLKAREINYILRDCTPKLLAVAEEFSDYFLQNELTSGVDILVELGERDNHQNIMSYRSLMDAGTGDISDIERDENDTAILMYTSGTTGDPKGVMLTHRSILSSVISASIERNMTDRDVYLQVVPLFHIGGIDFFLTTIFAGGTQHLFDKFDPDLVLDVLVERKITIVLLVPSMINMVVEAGKGKVYRFPELRLIYYGGSPIAVTRLKEALDFFGCDLMQGYGQTEASPLITILRPEDHSLKEKEGLYKLKSCGREAINVEVRIVDENNVELPPGEVGEIILKGHNIMKGYWNLLEETRKTIRNGWLYTGDLGWLDKDRYLYLVDRSKDTIISGGENIYPKEVENVIYNHPSVKEVAVIGVNDEKWGEVPKAFIVLYEEKRITRDELLAFCRENLAGFKIPKYIEFIEELPKNAVGKILKRELRTHNSN